MTFRGSITGFATERFSFATEGIILIHKFQSRSTWSSTWFSAKPVSMCHQVSKPQKMKPSLNQEEILWASTEKKQNKTASLSVFLTGRSHILKATYWNFGCVTPLLITTQTTHQWLYVEGNIAIVWIFETGSLKALCLTRCILIIARYRKPSFALAASSKSIMQKVGLVILGPLNR